jgi:hypothetical protein
MALRINIVSVATTGFTRLDVTADADRNAGGSIWGGHGLEIKKEVFRRPEIKHVLTHPLSFGVPTASTARAAPH